MRISFKLYKYLIMLFKLINTLTISQTYINNVLRKDFNVYVVIYLNNILIYLKNKQEHRKHVRENLTTLQKVNLRIKSEKI